MTIYLDSNFHCHLQNDGTMQMVSTTYFNGKCQEYVEGYCYIPAGQSWTRVDGKIIRGETYFPWKDINDLNRMQMLYEYQSVLQEIKDILGVQDNVLLLAKIRHNQIVTKTVEEVYNVYVKVNADNYITAIDSDAFIEDFSLWIKVDEGQGDLYKFAKNNYCKYGITTTDGSYNYKLVRGHVVYMPQEPVSPTPTIEERLDDIEIALCEILDMLAELTIQEE